MMFLHSSLLTLSRTRYNPDSSDLHVRRKIEKRKSLPLRCWRGRWRTEIVDSIENRGKIPSKSQR